MDEVFAGIEKALEYAEMAFQYQEVSPNEYEAYLKLQSPKVL